MNVQTSLQSKSLDELKELYENTSVPDSIVALNLTGDLNLGMCIRTASLFGISRFHILGRRRYDRRTTVGMDHYVPVERIGALQQDELNNETIISTLQYFSQSFNIVFVEQHKQAVSLTDFGKKITDSRPVMFVIGNEGSGIPKPIMENVSGLIVQIPQKGVGRSHNVSNALSMVLWEYYRNSFEDSIV